MPEDTFEDIRERLFEAAWDEPVYAPARERVVRRARRRVATTVGGAAFAALAAIVVINSALPTEAPERTAQPGAEQERVLVVDLSTNSVRTTSAFGSGAHFLEASPTGPVVAFVSERSGSHQIWTSTLQGSDAREITHDVYGAGWPAWSPDATRIAFAGYGTGSRPTLFTVDVASGRTHRILPTSEDEARGPAWSPDGTRIAYFVELPAPSIETGTTPSTFSTVGFSRVRIVDLATGRVRQVAGGKRVSSFDPTWLPDGRLLFMRAFDVTLNAVDRVELWVADPDGRHPTRLMQVAEEWAWAPRVSPDGSLVTFSADDGNGPSGQFVLELATGAIRRVSDGYGATWIDDDTLLVEAPPASDPG